MANPGDFAYTVKQQADIVRVIGEYVKLKKAGAQNFSGLCPFHNEKTPSFSVHATRQFYHCFGCGVSGDVFSFVQKIENITFPEAVRAIAQKLGIAIPKQTPASPAEAKEARLRGALIDMHEQACVFFQEQLQKPESAGAREYLAGRGLDQQTITQFRIGYAPDSGFLLRDRLKNNFDEEALKESGLLSWKPDGGDKAPMYSRFRNRIMFPIASEAGKIIAFTGRTLSTDDKAGPKYLNSPETAIYSKSRVLFNLDRAREHIRKFDYAILVEGQMDCISVFAAGFQNVIASSGTAFTESQVRLLARYSKRILVNFDPDTAGAAAAERSLGLLVAEDFRIKVLTLEPGYDPDLYIRKRGKDAYGAALKSAPDYFDYLMERARAQFRVQTSQGKVQAVNFLLPHLQRVHNNIQRDELAADMAQKLGIDSALLRQELKHSVNTRAGSIKTPAEPQVNEAEKIVVRVLSSREERELSVKIHDIFSAELLHQGLTCESLINALLASSTPDDPMNLELNEGDRRLLASILMNETQEELSPQLAEQALHALRRQRMERQQRTLKAQIAEAERKQDSATLARLMQEKLALDRSLSERK
ncbi:MAG TPA: DNA primase [Terriglobales bacterium]|jgi:DNA primase|nr:DNA primase [Terriglobales bacterium]